MFDRVGGRKLTLGLLILGIGITIGFIHGDIPDNVLQLMEFLFGAFVTGNSIGTIAGIVQSRTTTTSVEADQEIDDSTDVIDLAPMQSQLDTLTHSQAALLESVQSVQQTLAFIIKKYGIDRLPDSPKQNS